MLSIIKDDHPFQVILKSAQCGISEVKVAKAIHRAIYRKRNILYTMPAGEQMQQFVDSRARNAIITNDYLTKFVTGTLNLKKFSLNHHQIYFRGVQKRRQIITVDVSSLFLDELDTYEDERTVNTLDKRLGATKQPEKDYFSTPSFHGTGISLYYYGSDAQNERGSDQRVWAIKCEHCGQWNEDLLWEENVRDLNVGDSKFSFYAPDVIIICRFCFKQIDRLSSNAEWVAKLPSNSEYCHGYHISKLFSPIANLNQMWLDNQNPVKEQEFWNSDLGLPYEPKGSRITDATIDNARGSHQILIQSKIKSFIGIDPGAKIHAMVGQVDENNKIKIVSAIELDDWIDVPHLYKDFNANSVVIDMNPDKKEAIDFQKEFDHVWLAYYSIHLERTKDKFSKDDDSHVLAINRTLMMMLVSDLIHEKDVIFPIDIRRVRDFYTHLKSPIKAQKQDIHGDWLTFYPKTKEPDHYYHALLYMILATMLKPRPATFRIIKTMFN